jgi:hypothetical protein
MAVATHLLRAPLDKPICSLCQRSAAFRTEPASWRRQRRDVISQWSGSWPDQRTPKLRSRAIQCPAAERLLKILAQQLLDTAALSPSIRGYLRLRLPSILSATFQLRTRRREHSQLEDYSIRSGLWHVRKPCSRVACTPWMRPRSNDHELPRSSDRF